MKDYSQSAIDTVTKALTAYCKFITANDVGDTGSHQYGYYIHRDAYSILFDREGRRGEQTDRMVKIKWQDDFETSSRFIYYGEKTRNEYRITQFGHRFPFLNSEVVGSLLVLCKIEEQFYKAYVLETEEEINNFLDFFGISPIEANGIISQVTKTPSDTGALINQYAKTVAGTFPASKELSAEAQSIFNAVSGINYEAAVEDPDAIISGWIDTEYGLFKAIEQMNYGEHLKAPLGSVDNLTDLANTILNRRKSRAGKSLENHLAKIFDVNKLPYSAQSITEGHKKPDFIMPSIELYHDNNYSSNKLIFLGAKTTCKDRWRQILNEADRIETKHLFTLQPAISANQLKEMEQEKVKLVVPATIINSFPPADRSRILTLKGFINYSHQLFDVDKV